MFNGIDWHSSTEVLKPPQAVESVKFKRWCGCPCVSLSVIAVFQVVRTPPLP